MNARLYFALGTLAGLAALALVYLLQYVGGLEPCPLCIFQRLAVAVFLVVCAAGWVHGGGALAYRIYALLACLAAIAGLVIAGRHVWLMHLPPDQVPACGPGLDYLVHIMPLREVVATVLRGDASCATVKGAFLGIRLPTWSLVYFCVLTLGALASVICTPPDSIDVSR